MTQEIHDWIWDNLSNNIFLLITLYFRRLFYVGYVIIERYFTCCLQATERAPMMYPSKTPNFILLFVCLLSSFWLQIYKFLDLLIQIGSLLRKVFSRVQTAVDVAHVHRTFFVFISAKLTFSLKKPIFVRYISCARILFLIAKVAKILVF